MNGKKARQIRKELAERYGQKKLNLKNAEYKPIKSVKKNVYFRSKTGGLLPPQEVTRQVLVNEKKYVYRKLKKTIEKQKGM